MLPICQVCLRTDRKFQAIEKSIVQWHDEICDFSVEVHVQFCTECGYLLKKFNDFNKKCVLANKVLNSWKKDMNKNQLNLLYLKIPQSSLGLNKKHNTKIYFYNSDEVNTFDIKLELNTDLNTASSISNVIIEPEIDVNFQINNINQPCNKDQQSNRCKDTTSTTPAKNQIAQNKPSNNSTQYNFINTVKIEFDNDLHDNSLDLKSGNSSDNDNLSESSQVNLKKPIKKQKLKLEIESSDDELLIKTKQRMEKKVTKRKKQVDQEKPFNIEALKTLLINRFESDGDVKDEEGNIINKDCILNSLDKMHIYTLKQIKKRVSASSSFSPEALQVLSRAQKKYGDQYSSVFTTEHLPTMEDVLKEFNKRKEYEAYVASQFKCELCFRGFKHEKLLDYHVKVYHDTNLPQHCTICQMRFKTANAFGKHKLSHRAVFKCKLCPLITNYRTAMVDHYRQHMGMIYPCDLCDSTFKSKSTLHAHKNSMHSSVLACGLCAQKFASNTGLSQHCRRKHQNERIPESGPTCDKCNIVFVSHEVLDKHIEKTHFEKKVTNKKRNYTVPLQKPNYVCRVCNITEHSYGRIMWHYRREHPAVDYKHLYDECRKHLCHICGKKFDNATKLKEHKNTHTGAKPYACDKCPKSFHRKINLREHLERHLPPTRECPTCGKKFASATNLNNHMKIHIGIRQYKCELCSKSFLHRTSLRGHIQGVHYNIRRQRKSAKVDNVT